jgi:hypothetical protein
MKSKPQFKPGIVLAAATAGLAWIGLALELSGFIHRALMQQLGVLHGVWSFCYFFTNISNILAALALTLWVCNGGVANKSNRLDITGVLAYVWLSGIIYNLVLRGFIHASVVANVVLHDAVPLLFLGFWWLYIPRMRFSVKQVLSWLLFPIAYFIYVLTRGAASGRYPYSFLDVSKFGYASIMVNALGIMFALLARSMLLVVLNRYKKK